MCRTPDFLGIAAARSGTTCLGKTLADHDDIWIPRRNQLHYLSDDEKYPTPSCLRFDSPSRRLLAPGGAHNRFRYEFIKAFRRDLLCADRRQFKWALRYYLCHYDECWYGLLFGGRAASVVGGITPAFALLDDHDVTVLADRYHDLKIIYIVRGRAGRTLSTIYYHNSRGWIYLKDMTDEKMFEYLCSPNICQRTAYTIVIDRGERTFGQQKFILTFFDEISQHPLQLLERLVKFLYVSPFPASEKLMSARVNRSSGPTLPDSIRDREWEQYRDELAGLSARSGRYSAAVGTETHTRRYKTIVTSGPGLLHQATRSIHLRERRL